MRRSVRTLAAGSALAAALLTASCQAKEPTPTPTPTPTPAATTTTAAPVTAAALPTGPVTAAQLVAALPPRPAGAKAWAGRGGPSGALTQKQYLTVEFGAAEAPKALAAERQLGLRSGAQRAWQQRNGTQVLVTFGDYRDRTGAKAAYLQIEAALEQDDAGATDFTLPGAADSYGIGTAAGSELLVLAGSELLHVEVKSPDSVGTAKAVALQAYGNLCRLSDCTAGSTS
ncbi:hypothetical protein ACEZDB_02125 [Streptacidiphilus sp. N1-3]|uniref:Sporulation and spore germination n=1 Tax=Streptacidiphilus alkalitolerans TaxID=3342712 RepID=A0ABV6WTU2_9ACTN